MVEIHYEGRDGHNVTESWAELDDVENSNYKSDSNLPNDFDGFVKFEDENGTEKLVPKQRIYAIIPSEDEDEED